jgi:hypothetical protein
MTATAAAIERQRQRARHPVRKSSLLADISVLSVLCLVQLAWIALLAYAAFRYGR